MIKSNYGKVELKGDAALLAAEFVSIVGCFYKKRIFKKRDLKRFLKDGFKARNNIKGQDEGQEMFKEILKAIKEDKADINNGEIVSKTILDNDNVKITKIDLSGSEKSKTEIEEMIKEIFKKEGFLDE